MEKHISEFLFMNEIIPSIESGYRRNHSCLTGLLHVTDTILQTSHHKLCTILILLDFSRAFDIINYYVLMAIISYRCDETIIQQQTKSEGYLDGTYSNVVEIK